MNHSAQLFIFPLFWWEHWVCLKLPIKTNTGRPHAHTCLFSPALKKKLLSPSGRDMQSSISLGIEFILPTQWLIKQALCALPLPCGKCLRWSRVLSLWAAQSARCEFFMVTAHICFSSGPKVKSGSLAYNTPCVGSGAAVISRATHLPHRAK